MIQLFYFFALIVSVSLDGNDIYESLSMVRSLICNNITVTEYTGGFLVKLLDTDMHSAVTAKATQRCDSDGADSNVAALTVTALGHQWL